MYSAAKSNDDQQYLKALNSPLKNSDEPKVEKKQAIVTRLPTTGGV